MRNIKLIIEYDGTNYFGWQKQPNQATIQETLEDSIKKVTKEDVNIIGSGRTDRGVHARGQVANFFTDSRIPSEKFKDAINANLPKDIAISHSEEVDSAFHSRYSAKGKEYRYLIYNRRVPSPLLRNLAYHVPQKLDFNIMRKSATDIVGTHDFRSFMASGSSVEDTTRTVYSVQLDKNYELIEFRINGNGFLYNMVRIVVGTLVDIGMGKICSSSIPEIILSRERKNAGHTAPPHGLYLERVLY
ncbi:tRNA pseudouridine synthase A [Proteiniborus sp. DW1]|uniref:tRNA pseudouridine(38-40) synthase TruA n=1 Tax=Proteiniborus sp. DW1 TaxID=1889883 RepID=UPI00092DF8D4|nr:tRNA pseudouridine(38-40) synthase TruA [Proteiniborus sp. DW1]SCG84070.1 tRNA pseudouridine synthase A [Proteiniborus sp. DW1]